MQQEIRELSLEVIDDPKQPMRSSLEQDSLTDLANSIRQVGLINPITVRPKGDRYEVVAGHRRFRACGQAGVFRIKCIVADVTDDQVFDLMAHENLNRLDIDPVEEALFLSRLIGKDETKISEAARRLNRSITWVEDRLELLGFSDPILSVLRQGKIKLGVAQWLGRITNDFWQIKFLDQAVAQGMSVLQSRYLHDQFQMGIFPNAGDILPANDDLKTLAHALVKVPCEKCGKIAVEPNIRSVFIHSQCPDEEISTL